MHDRPQRPRPGDRVNLAESALKRWWTGSEQRDLHTHDLKLDANGYWRPERDPATGLWHIGLEWPEPRDIREFTLWCADDVPPGIRLQYWQKNWPTPAPERRTGARRGWIGRDDPWHGRWTTVRANQTRSEGLCSWDFDPLDLAEMGDRESVTRLEEAEHYLARFRRTLKIRLVSEGSEQPVITGFGAYSDAIWQEKQVIVRLGLGQACVADWSGHAELLNGYITCVEPYNLERIEANDCWLCPSGTQPKRIRLNVLCTDAGPESADRTIVTVRTTARSSSFLIPDLARGPIYIKDYGALVTWADGEIDVTTLETRLATMPKPIYDRVESEPEHSLAKAMLDIPPLDVVKQDSYTGLGRYLPLGLEAGRQEWALRYNGDLFADKVQLKLKGRDAARLLWPGHRLHFRFGSGDPPTFHDRKGDTKQSLHDGWLPVVASQWLDREVAYEQTTFGAPLNRPMNEASLQGDTDVVAMMRFVIRNTTHGLKWAHLWMIISPSEQLEMRQGLVLAHGRIVPAEPVARQWRVQPYKFAYLRCVVHSSHRGTWAAVPFAQDAGASLAARRPSCTASSWKRAKNIR
jgi:hypothetical protein